MDGEKLFSLILILLGGGGSALLCLGLARAAARSEKPFGFWSWKEVKPESVTDIPAYNQENARLWRRYSIPYFTATAAGILGIWFDIGAYLCLALLFLACTLGLWWLISSYRKIEKRYIHS